MTHRYTAILAVNSFLNTAKFSEIYAFLQRSAEKRNIRLDIKKTADIPLIAGTTISKKPDFILWWDKDVNLAALYEGNGIRLYNSSNAIELCDNKAKTVSALSGNPKIKLPKTLFAPKTFQGIGYTDLSFLDRAEELIGYPLIIKECYGSFGAQVYLAHNRAEAEDIIIHRIVDRDFIMQEFIESSFGRDVRINVVDGRAVASMIRHNSSDFRSNITGGGRTVQYTPTEEQINAALEACKTLGLDFAGVDVLFGENNTPIICEVNSNPHFKSTYDCTGIDLAEHIFDMIIKDLEK